MKPESIELKKTHTLKIGKKYIGLKIDFRSIQSALVVNNDGIYWSEQVTRRKSPSNPHNEQYW